jgi:hypothetical protein
MADGRAEVEIEIRHLVVLQQVETFVEQDAITIDHMAS